MDIERKPMDMWSSVITTRRAKALGRIIERVQTVTGKNPVNRQVGNVVSDLRNLHEFDLIHELEGEIEAYNQDVLETNKRVALRRDLHRAIKAWAQTSKQRAFVKHEVDYIELEQLLEEATRGLGYQPSVYSWARGEVSRQFARYS